MRKENKKKERAYKGEERRKEGRNRPLKLAQAFSTHTKTLSHTYECSNLLGISIVMFSSV